MPMPTTFGPLNSLTVTRPLGTLGAVKRGMSLQGGLVPSKNKQLPKIWLYTAGWTRWFQRVRSWAFV